MSRIAFIILILIQSSLHAGDINAFFENMKNKDNQYKEASVKINTDANTSSKNIIDTIKEKSANNTASAIPFINKTFNNNNAELDIKAAEMLVRNEEQKKILTIFYLFSTSQSEYMFFNFVKEAGSLEILDKNIQYFGVVQGLLEQKDLEKLYIPFENKKSLKSKAVIKMQPFIFREFNLKQVPAYLISECSKSDFKFDECENKYLIRGEISLAQVFEIITEHSSDKKYVDFRNFLQKGEK